MSMPITEWLAAHGYDCKASAEMLQDPAIVTAADAWDLCRDLLLMITGLGDVLAEMTWCDKAAIEAFSAHMDATHPELIKLDHSEKVTAAARQMPLEIAKVKAALLKDAGLTGEQETELCDKLRGLVGVNPFA